jgi:hypothetical protein
MAREVVRESTNDLIKEYLASERLRASSGKGSAGAGIGGGAADPLMVFVQEECVDVVVQEEADEIARSLVRSLAQDHLFRVWMSGTLDEMADGENCLCMRARARACVRACVGANSYVPFRWAAAQTASTRRRVWR